MKWLIPAKTFLLGEYAALTEASAILLTTMPCFELTLIPQKSLSGIHPESPAGIWWQKHEFQEKGLFWDDPYAGLGGLGASSAQFLGSYLASCLIDNKKPNLEKLLSAYFEVCWTNKGLRPSGYDLIAQSQQNCVYINRQQKVIKSYSWPFQKLSFFLIHTGKKLATHYHLQDAILPDGVDYLSSLVDHAKQAFEQADANQLIMTINEYHRKLSELNLVADHSVSFIKKLKEYPEILAIKGCGALGADILLLITASEKRLILSEKLRKQHWKIIASENSIYSKDCLLD